MLLNHSSPLNRRHTLNKGIVASIGMLPFTVSQARLRSQTEFNHMTVGSGMTIRGQVAAFSSSALTIPSTVHAKINGIGKISIGLWIYPTSFGTYKCVFDSTNRHTSFFMNTGTDLYVGFGGTAGGLTGTIAFTLNEWQYCLVTYDGTTVNVYRNGVLTATRSLGNVVFTDPILFGTNPSTGGSNYQGLQSTWRVWSVTLNAKQARELYAQAKVNFKSMYNWFDINLRESDPVVVAEDTQSQLGRFRRGMRVGIECIAGESPVEAPTVEYYREGTELVKSGRLPSKDGDRKVFGHSQFLDSDFEDGRYVAIIRYAITGSTRVHLRAFEVVGGDSRGQVISVLEMRRSLGRAIVAHREDGIVTMGYNPKVQQS